MRRKIIIVLSIAVLVGVGVLGYTRATNKSSAEVMLEAMKGGIYFK